MTVTDNFNANIWKVTKIKIFNNAKPKQNRINDSNRMVSIIYCFNSFIAPYFKHCPKERLILSTLGRKYVDIRAQVNLTVVDKSGKKYAVTYSETFISAKPCNCTENYHIIIALSEVDKHGRFATCMFNVHVFGKSSFSDLQMKNEEKL